MGLARNRGWRDSNYLFFARKGAVMDEIMVICALLLFWLGFDLIEKGMVLNKKLLIWGGILLFECVLMALAFLA